MSETKAVPVEPTEHDLYEVARFVGITGSQMARLIGVLKMLAAQEEK